MSLEWKMINYVTLLGETSAPHSKMGDKKRVKDKNIEH